MNLNKILILFLMLSIVSTSFSQLIYPTGTEKLDDNLYIDEFPITNAGYSEFLNCIKIFWNHTTSEFIQDLPKYGLEMDGSSDEELYTYDITLNFTKKTDSAITIYGMTSSLDSALYKEMLPPIDSLIFDSLPLKIYLEHIVYRDYPAVYITKNQAENYCKWRSDMVSLRIALQTKDSKDFAKYAAPVNYKLPSKEEWIKAYNISLNNKSKKGKNYYGDELEPIDSFWEVYNKKAKFQFYDQLGKLSEITSDNEIIGYNWQDSTLKKDSVVLRQYISPSSGIGFRCACEIQK